jgi:hypothetical protein
MQNTLRGTRRAVGRIGVFLQETSIFAGGWALTLLSQFAYAQDSPSATSTVIVEGLTPSAKNPVQGLSKPFDPTPDFLLWVIVSSVYVLVFFSLAFVIGRLSKTPDGGMWRLSEALSEEATEESGGVKTIRLVGSTSRLIALFGLIVILILFLSFGVIAIWTFGRTGKIPPDLAELAKYLLGGAALFIPYGINQIRAAFDNVAK